MQIYPYIHKLCIMHLWSLLSHFANEILEHHHKAAVAEYLDFDRNHGPALKVDVRNGCVVGLNVGITQRIHPPK